MHAEEAGPEKGACLWLMDVWDSKSRSRPRKGWRLQVPERQRRTHTKFALSVPRALDGEQEYAENAWRASRWR